MLKKNYLIKTKAVFQIVLVIFSIFLLTFSEVEEVEAQEQNVCCSETVSGEHCVYTGVSNCAPGALQSAATCEQTSFCKSGCGFDQQDGVCFNNMPKFSCEEEEGCQWSENPTCDIPQCEKGCCVLSNQCSFVTQIQCKQVTSQYEDINMSFDESIDSELTCLNECRSFERGACVHSDGSCDFVTRELCEEVNPSASNATLPLIGFYPDMLCSNPRLGTECAGQQYTGCLPNDDGIYWFDSCGNPENIYDADKVASYNEGYVLSKEDSCGPGNANIESETCGNCNYALGSICALAEVGVNPRYGDYACKDLSCDVDVVTVDPNAPASQNLPRLNGESWCAYDGLVGFSESAGLGLDLAGSRHYRRKCVNGEEITDSCSDFREEICIQGEIDLAQNPELQLIYGTQESFERSGNNLRIYAACRDNRYESCVDMDTKYDCENKAVRDCIWLLGDEEDTENIGGDIDIDYDDVACIPIVPPGVKHWSGESVGEDNGLDPSATCDKGSTSCDVDFYKEGIDGDWRCVGNCDCLDVEYLEQTNAVCKSLGDCGAWYNIAGQETYDGFVENLDSSFRTVSVDVELEGTLPPFSDLGISRYGTGEAASSKSFEDFWMETRDVWGGLAVSSAVFSLATPGIGFFSAMFGTSISGTSAFIGGAIGKGSAWGAAQTVAGEAAVEGGVASATGTTGIASFAYALNMIMWVYLAYQILNVLFADEETQTVSITCKPWQAPIGGENCELCQENGKVCSEYRCKSLGQSCKLVNVGMENEKCIDSNPNDVTPPYINVNKTLTVHLTDSVDSESDINDSPGNGFEIVPKIAPFTAVSLVLDTNEHAQCKFDINSRIEFEDMSQYFGDGGFDKTHIMTFGLPGTLAEDEILQLTNGGNYQIYVKCQDGNGNENFNDYYIKFGIDPGPDFTPPIIEMLSIANGAYVANGVNSTELSIYVNEPSTCKWDDMDVGYDNMFNYFSCTNSPFPTNSLYYGLYECDTTLTGIQDGLENFYYFKCEDQPTSPEEDRNVNMQSYKFSLKGTHELNINSVYPDDGIELKYPSPVLKVTTGGGAYNNGVSICGYSFTDPDIKNSIEFLNTNSSNHEQPFFNLSEGNYNVYVGCIDVAGNIANEIAEFDMVVDLTAPQISQVYTEPGILYLIMDEPSTCEYSVTGPFNYGSGIPMTGTMIEEHTASIEGDIYHLMCKDSFENVGSYIIYLV